jgi:hypothetical protein
MCVIYNTVSYFGNEWWNPDFVYIFHITEEYYHLRYYAMQSKFTDVSEEIFAFMLIER